MKSSSEMIQAANDPMRALVRPSFKSSTLGGINPRPFASASSLSETDTVVLSDIALAEAERIDTPIREDLVRRIRAEIRSGNYLTEEKIDGAVEQLARELFSAP